MMQCIIFLIFEKCNFGSFVFSIIQNTRADNFIIENVHLQNHQSRLYNRNDRSIFN